MILVKQNHADNAILAKNGLQTKLCRGANPVIKQMKFTKVFIAVLLLIPPATTLAAPAITCHCFTDRSYDPQHPALADPYFLASAQNSFFAAVFGVDKKSIVLKKQQGAMSDDLWISHWLAKQANTTAEKMMQKRHNQTSWSQTIKQAGMTQEVLGQRLAAALQNNAADTALADAVVDSLLLSYGLYREPVLAQMRKSGANSKELVIAALIAAKTGAQPGQIYRNVTRGATSWGGQLQQAKITSQNLQHEISAMVR